MSFEIVFTQSALSSSEDDESVLADCAREKIVEISGGSLSVFEEQLFHSFVTDAGREYICMLTADGAVRVDACSVDPA